MNPQKALALSRWFSMCCWVTKFLLVMFPLGWR
jgi:hypothetical protein